MKSLRGGSGSDGRGRSVPGGRVERTGFETNCTVHLEGGVGWVYSEALDGEGRSLGTSEIETTFVPGPGLAEYCGEFGCGGL